MVDVQRCPSPVVSADEQERADRIRSEPGRARFLGSRAWLRVVLGLYLDVEPAAVRLSVDARGKPSIVGGGDLRFSLSRSAGAALIAVTRGRSVGVDIEHVRDDVEHDRMAERFYAPAEAALLRALPDGERRRAFFELWVRKEAVVKVSGLDLAPGLRLDVCGALVSGRWSVGSFDVGAGFAAALSLDGALGPVRLEVPLWPAHQVNGPAERKPTDGEIRSPCLVPPSGPPRPAAIWTTAPRAWSG
jgi:phosphopantetheinyl transferase